MHFLPHFFLPLGQPLPFFLFFLFFLFLAGALSQPSPASMLPSARLSAARRVPLAENLVVSRSKAAESMAGSSRPRGRLSRDLVRRRRQYCCMGTVGRGTRGVYPHFWGYGHRTPDTNRVRCPLLG